MPAWPRTPDNPQAGAENPRRIAAGYTEQDFGGSASTRYIRLLTITTLPGMAIQLEIRLTLLIIAYKIDSLLTNTNNFKNRREIYGKKTNR
jgi:hypothetical protein